MKVLGLKIERSNEHPGYVVLFDNAHGLDIYIHESSGFFHATVRIGGITVVAPLRTTLKESAEAIDEGLRALWGAMASILAESRK